MASREWTRNSIIELIDWYLRRHPPQGGGSTSKMFALYPYTSRKYNDVPSSDSKDAGTAGLYRIVYNPANTALRFNGNIVMNGNSFGTAGAGNRAATLAYIKANSNNNESFTATIAKYFFDYFNYSNTSLPYVWVFSGASADTIVYKLRRLAYDEWAMIDTVISRIWASAVIPNTSPVMYATMGINRITETAVSTYYTVAELEELIRQQINYTSTILTLVVSDTKNLPDDFIISLARVLGAGTKSEVQVLTI